MAIPPVQTGLVFDHAFRRHDPGEGHPEHPARYLALSEAFKRADFLQTLARIPARVATQEDLHLAHTQHYLKVVQHDAARGARILSTGDTVIGESTLEVAQLAAGAGMAAVDAVCEGRVRNVFAAVRPPGHHATASRGMGFCVYNTVAIAARYALKAYGVDGILIIDWDVHHGNGTQEIFYERGDVYFLSFHEWPLYPGTGREEETGSGAGRGCTRNVTIAPYTPEADYLDRFSAVVTEVHESFKPDFVLISAGFDAHHRDPLAHLRLTETGFARMTELVLDLAQSSAAGRVVSLLEGGYDLNGLAHSVAAHLEKMAAAAAP